MKSRLKTGILIRGYISCNVMFYSECNSENLLSSKGASINVCMYVYIEGIIWPHGDFIFLFLVLVLN